MARGDAGDAWHPLERAEHYTPYIYTVNTFFIFLEANIMQHLVRGSFKKGIRALHISKQDYAQCRLGPGGAHGDKTLL